MLHQREILNPSLSDKTVCQQGVFTVRIQVCVPVIANYMDILEAINRPCAVLYCTVARALCSLLGSQFSDQVTAPSSFRVVKYGFHHIREQTDHQLWLMGQVRQKTGKKEWQIYEIRKLQQNILLNHKKIYMYL